MLPLPPIKISKTKNKFKRMIMPCCPCDERDAGCCGGEIVGETEMTDEEIAVV
jgi:hypothetical protein